MLISRVESADLFGIYIILSIIGAALALYVMQKTWHDELANTDPWILRWLRRIAMAGISLALCWSVIFMDARGIPPPLPFVVLVVAIDFLLLIRAIALYWRGMPSHRLLKRIIKV